MWRGHAMNTWNSQSCRFNNICDTIRNNFLKIQCLEEKEETSTICIFYAILCLE